MDLRYVFADRTCQNKANHHTYAHSNRPSAPSTRTLVRILRGKAPSAMRIPNSRVRRYRESQDAGNAHHRDQECHSGESAKDDRVQPVGSQHLSANIAERAGLLHGLVCRHLMNSLCDRRDQCVCILMCAYKQAAIPALLLSIG